MTPGADKTLNFQKLTEILHSANGIEPQGEPSNNTLYHLHFSEPTGFHPSFTGKIHAIHSPGKPDTKQQILGVRVVEFSGSRHKPIIFPKKMIMEKLKPA